MQPTRQRILEHLKTHGPTTVDKLAAMLGLTTVTVRHHLEVLRGEELVSPPVVKHRASPGRPQYEYLLTDKASAHFPKHYDDLAAKLLAELKAAASPEQLSLIFRGVTRRTAAEGPRPAPGDSLTRRLEHAVAFLDERGFVASAERRPEGFTLFIHNCPYEALAAQHPELCGVDHAVITQLLGVMPECTGRLAEGAGSCSFLIRENAAPAAR